MQSIYTYLTISNSSAGIFKDKGSKFLAFAYPVKKESDVKELLDMIKKQYLGAKHYCYAYQLGYENILSRFNDDREPTGTAGKPIIGQIIAHNLTNILIIIVRYFGGVLLGTGGLINAYKSASLNAITNATIIEKYIYEHYLIIFNHDNMNKVMKIIKDNQLDYYEQHFDINCQLKVKIKKIDKNAIISKLSLISDIKSEFLLVE